MSQPIVHTMYWENIPARLLEKQKAVFAHLDIPLQQELADKKPHGRWMNELLAHSHTDDLIVICDIDAFPLNRQAYLQAIAFAQAGGLFGLTQFSNHKPGNDVYAGPMFMAFRKQLWESLGRPELQSSKQHDAAEIMTALARQKSIPLSLCPPTSCLIPKWPLANEGIFGIGTFYGHNQFFHLFESRKPAYERIFEAVAQDVEQDRPLDFKQYLELAAQLQEQAPIPQKPWWKLL